MSDIVEPFNPCGTQKCKDRCLQICHAEEICIGEIESLRQQLAECQALQGEPVAQICSWGCQLIGDTADEFKKDRVKFMGTPLYAAPVNLDILKRQWQREALLEAADYINTNMPGSTGALYLRRMAEELKDE